MDRPNDKKGQRFKMIEFSRTYQYHRNSVKPYGIFRNFEVMMFMDISADQKQCQWYYPCSHIGGEELVCVDFLISILLDEPKFMEVKSKTKKKRKRLQD